MGSCAVDSVVCRGLSCDGVLGFSQPSAWGVRLARWPRPRRISDRSNKTLITILTSARQWFTSRTTPNTGREKATFRRVPNGRKVPVVRDPSRHRHCSSPAAPLIASWRPGSAANSGTTRSTRRDRRKLRLPARARCSGHGR
ncbi:hypothetical protein SAMN05443377_11755 [Propionibacterium cyclohexanicum]|uniref:Uncharacterized protein n=1 Tax=Propionibacterium cyclohexanicum TaxID=64702 RepID=A0A1H9T1J7_9ACTN|nr:hypothetical protein SAMN05443377_11755 [Propionibacterium cyclohexanicum]